MHRALAIAILMFGCRDQQLASIEAIRDEVCACETAACGEAALKKVPQDKLKAGPKMQEAGGKMMDCLAKLYERGRPSTDIDEDVTSPGSAAPASAETP
jgi:hypothetical protein